MAKSVFLEALGKRLAEIQVNSGQGVREFCTARGLNASAWSALTRGEKTLYAETLAEISKKVGKSADWILSGELNYAAGGDKGTARVADPAWIKDPKRHQLLTESKEVAQTAEDDIIEALLKIMQALRRRMSLEKKTK